ncbi:alpha/beta fold hydrolase [Streptomyces sp. NPDC088354]|uniref:alpha/beta fold hydrolase n=1 Tax=unclassified Streptomyces TaxID=2593676 RepID=UPI0029B75B42|nr:alpha/beta fold hydrolase [Streptomyces sp. MI02-7b]MDX3078453.1 alpha/beta fold hydrolase [Streptomyces sp. MI02-7b]
MDDLLTTHVNGIRLAYRTWGDPGAPPLVLLHGRGSDGADWAPVVPALARTHRVLAPDLRGHGASERPGEYAFEAMRDDVVGLLDALGLEKAALAGHSMGGVVAYLLAAARPERLTALVLEEPVPPDPAVPPRTVPTGPEGGERFDWRVVAAVNRWINAPDPGWWDLLGRITCPTLVIAGGPASHVSQDGIERIAARIPGARLVATGAGHLVHEDDPERFLEEVSAFLAGPRRP